MYKWLQVPSTSITSSSNKREAGAFQLLQLQEDMRRQFKMDGSGSGNDIDTHILMNKDTLMSSLWKLNVVDIEMTLVHVCQMVSFSLFQWSYYICLVFCFCNMFPCPFYEVSEIDISIFF